MKTYQFRFVSRSALERALSGVMSCEYVVDCLVDVPRLRLRFRAPVGPQAERLFETIHRDGEIVDSNATDPRSILSPWWDSPEPGRGWC